MNSVREEIYDRAKSAILDLDEQAVKRIAQEALDAGINPIDLIEQGFVTGMKEIGDIFDAGEFQLRQILKAYHIVESGIDVLRPKIVQPKQDIWLFGKLVRRSESALAYPSITQINESLSSGYCR